MTNSVQYQHYLVKIYNQLAISSSFTVINFKYVITFLVRMSSYLLNNVIVSYLMGYRDSPMGYAIICCQNKCKNDDLICCLTQRNLVCFQSWRSIINSIIFHLLWQSNEIPFSNSRHSQKSISYSLQIEWNMIVVTVFLSILNRIEFHEPVSETMRFSLIAISVIFSSFFIITFD